MKGTANGYTIVLLSVIAVCLLAVPAMAQEEIIWQHSAIIPWDAERLANNNTLITEYGNHTIIEVNTTTNEIVWQYGTEIAGSGPDQLNSPVDAERLLNGNTLITDRNNHRVIEVNSTGAIVWQYGTTGTSGSGYDELNNPMDAERLASGNTLIADRLNNRVIEVNELKGIVWQYGITNPFDADRLPDGNTLIIEYTNHRVIEINESDEIVWQYGDGTAGSGVNQLRYPMDADRLLDGNTLIADYVNDRVIEVRTSDYDLAGADNGFTAASIVWEYVSNQPADADRLSGGSTLINEAGNNSVIEVVIGDVDIIPIAIETAPPTLYTGLTLCEVTVTMFNNGSDHSGMFNASLYAGGIEVNTKVVDDIPAGDSRNVTLEWIPTQAGDHNLTVVADSDNAIVETNEGNNELTIEVAVLPATVKRLTFDPGSSVSSSVAVDSKGNQHVVWVDDRDGEGYRNRYTWYPCPMLYYNKLAPDGTVLVSDTRLTQLAESPELRVSSSITPAIAIDSNDNVCVVWSLSEFLYYPWPRSGYYKINDSICYMKLNNDGDIVIAPKQVISGKRAGGHYGFWFIPTTARGIAVDSNDNIHVVGFLGTPGRLPANSRQGIVYARLDNEGNELVNHTIEYITSPPYGTWDCMNAPSGIAVDSNGNAYTTYNRGLGACAGSGCSGFTCTWPTCAKAWYVKIDGDGVHKQDLTGNLPLPSLYPSVCADSGDNKHVIWSQHNGSNGFDFYYTKFDKSDTKVIDGKRLTYEDYFVPGCTVCVGGISRWVPICPSLVNRPIIDSESGIIHAAWSQESNIHYMGFDTSGGTLINRTLISLEDGSSWAPDIDACPDGSHLVWTDNRDGNNEIYYAKTVAPPNRVFVLAPPDQWTPQDIVATYTIGILSTMPNTETFTLKRVNLDHAGVAELSSLTITLEPYSIGEVTLNVTDRRVGDYRVTVTATSQSNSEIQGSATITTDVIVPIPDLLITAMDAYHNETTYSPYFNLSNEVDVKVKNIGTKDVGAFDVGLYANDTLVDTQSVSGLGYGSSTIVQFKWTPVGMDCEDGGSQQTYTLKAIADCGDVISESDETNNNLTAEETAYWAGYSADEPIDAIAWHGVLRGGLNYTTGDGYYTGLYSPGSSVDTHYSITLPSGASIELARLNVYYTWSKDYSTGVYPAMKVSITNTSGTYVVPINASYDDRPCDTPAISYDYPFGNHVFDLTPYITGDGNYTVTVENVGTTGHSFCIAAPGVVLLYKDSSKPEREFWILEGADLLEGGRRGGAGNLALSECISNATFAGSIDTGRVETATLGIVSAWGGSAWGADLTSYYWFNDNYLGDGSILGGYSSVYDETVNGMSMLVANAQVGANVSDVTGYITGQDNFASFGDDGDSMMPANAFLVVEYAESEYCREEKPEPAVLVPFMISGSVTNYSDGTQIDNPGVTIKNVNTGEPLPDVETHNDSNYYQVLTSLDTVSCGDVLQFTCDGTRLKHTIRQREVDVGGFVLDIAVGMMPEAIEAGVTFDLKRLDLNSSGVLKAYITLPEGYDVADIDVSTVECEGALTFGDGSVIPGKQALEVKFKIPDLEDVPTGDAVVLTVTGELDDGTPFEASNTLKVV